MIKHLAAAAIAASLAFAFALPVTAVEVTPGAVPKLSGVYVGLAASPQKNRTGNKGRVFVTPDMDDAVVARNQARTECELATGGLCNAISADSSREVIAILCRAGQREEAFLGTNVEVTPWRSAVRRANEKRFSDNQCSLVGSYPDDLPH